MSGKLRAGALAAVVGLTAGVLVPGAAMTTASAATSEESVRDDDGDRVAVAHFNSGLHGFHTGTSTTGVNSFDVLDWCNDGLVVALTWDVEGEGVSSWDAGEDCSWFFPFKAHGVRTGQAWEHIKEMEWYVWVHEEGSDLPEYGGEFQQDWMGSYSHDPDAEFFFHTSIYMDESLTGKAVTATMYPTEDAVQLDGDNAEAMWDELTSRTPFPDDLTEDQLESLFKQLWCHAQYAATPIIGGPTWDLEADRPNIPWEDVQGIGDVYEHECNWGGGGGGGSSQWPTGPGEEIPEDLLPVVNAGPDVSGDEGAPVTLDGYAADDHGVPDTQWTYEPREGVDEGASCEFSDPANPKTDITCTDDGEFLVTLTADDGVNPPVSDSAIVTLDNVAPTLSLEGPQEWDLYRVEDDVEIAASFTDPGANDTHTCTVTWDDGSESEFEAQDGSCDVAHAFDDAGMYTVDITVTDDDGGSDSASAMVVVYDPRAGLLTGAGTLDDAVFAVVAKYPAASSTRPLGSVALEVPTDDGTRTLLSTNLEWLVITPDGKAAVKGESVDHGFVGYAEAGRFRGVVWPLAEGDVPPEEPMYDSSPGASWDVDEAEPAEVSTGVMIIDSGWIPGLPELPEQISDILDELALPDLGLELPGLPLLPGLL